MFGGAGPMGGSGQNRRDSMPSVAGRGYSGDFGTNDLSKTNACSSELTRPEQRMGGSQRHHSVSDYDGIRSPSASSVQGYYANQRFGPRGGNEADQVMQAKRRMAAQRERELRNYHQEQQYNRSKNSESGQEA